ncbi:MAG: DUF6809 family protein [Aminipila sp.]
MNELKDLYTLSCSYAENFGYNSSKEWKAIAKQSKDLSEELSSVLDDTHKEKLEQLHSLHAKQTGLETDRMFFYAFRCGANLIMDIKSE